MGRRKQDISIYQIAAESGLSASTVSRVINRRVGVGDIARKKVESLLCKYNFTSNYPASRAARIAVLLPHATFNNYVSMAIQGVLSYTSTHEISSNIISRGENPKESLLEMVRDQQCNGIIGILAEEFQDEYQEIADSELPAIFIDTHFSAGNAGFIDNDSYTGAMEAVKHLLGLGHKEIGFLKNIDDHLNHIQRFRAYEDALKQAGIVPKPEWIQRNLPSDRGSESTRCLLTRAPEITALMAVDDKLALGAMAALLADGMRIPEDISIVGFDNIPDSAFWYPPLTTVDHPISKATALATEEISNYLKAPGKWIPPQITLPTKLIIRQSSGPVRTRN